MSDVIRKPAKLSLSHSWSKQQDGGQAGISRVLLDCLEASIIIIVIVNQYQIRSCVLCLGSY